jgi:hypothetical protein
MEAWQQIGETDVWAGLSGRVDNERPSHGGRFCPSTEEGDRGTQALEVLGIEEVVTAPRSPWQSAFTLRFIVGDAPDPRSVQ